MSRRPFVPSQLRTGPFTVAQALEAGLTKDHLKSGAWRRLRPFTYCDARLPDTPLLHLEALALNLPPPAAFSGKSAAFLHGLSVDGTSPIEATVPRECNVAARSGAKIRRSPLPPAEVVVRAGLRAGLRATAIRRTIAELAETLSLVDAVVVADEALHKRRVSLQALTNEAARRQNRYGVKSLRRLLDLVEPNSESPMETRLRLLIVQAGLPRPLAQYEIRTENGLFVARVDLAYPERRLAIEYDGGIHRDRLIADNRRQNLIVEARWRVLRFTAPDVNTTPGATAAGIGAALKESIAL